MLACKLEEEKLSFPYVASNKIDGIRCIIKDGVALSRTLKPIPNKFIQEIIGNSKYNGFDGELVVGSPTDHNCMQNSMSGVMTIEGKPDFEFIVFDKWDDEGGYIQRYNNIHLDGNPFISKLSYTFVTNSSDLSKFVLSSIAEGYEGTMLRNIAMKYKFGRATMKQGQLIKVKEFQDSEAEVIGMVPEVGIATGLPKDSLGSLLVTKDGVEFSIGTGFTRGQREEFWKFRHNYIGKKVTFKHFEIGSKRAPRFPTFKCFREDIDIGA